MLFSCIEDSYTTSPSQQPRFEVDTLRLGTVFTGEATPTSRFKIYNPHDKILTLKSVSLRDDSGVWRINVDGTAGNRVTDVDIRPRDSIFVFVEATLPDCGLDRPVNYRNHIDVDVMGVVSEVVLDADGLDAVRLNDYQVTADETFDPSRPYIVYGDLTVLQGATLTLPAGTRLNFHAGASMVVDGSLKSLGTCEAPVTMTGDRMGTVVGRVDYELMSGQWEGLTFTPFSTANEMEYTSVRNTVSGVTVDSVAWTPGTPSLRLLNCQFRNSQGYALVSSFSRLEATGCEFTDASAGVVALQGGEAALAHCTIASYYLFTAPGGPHLQLFHVVPGEEIPDVEALLLQATIDNCIIYGNGVDLSHGNLEGTQVQVRNCLLRSAGSDDNEFVNCLWDSDPLFYTVRNDYLFDYRVKPDSPAIDAADPALTPSFYTADRLGVAVNGTIGAYSFTPVEETAGKSWR